MAYWRQDCLLLFRKVKTLGVNKEGGVPDGMALDHEGRIWTALCGGSAVVCIDPESGDELHRYTCALVALSNAVSNGSTNSR